MATLRQFARRIRQLGRRVERNGPEIARRVALAVDQVVVLSTPVDEGRARSNWQVNIGSPARGTRPPFFPGRGGSTGAQNSAQAIFEAQSRIAGFQGEGTIHITNNLDYIGDLNDGSSAQAPAGFVQDAVLTGVNTVRGARVLRD